MKFTIAAAIVASILGAQAAPHPQITEAPVPYKCPIKECGIVTSTALPQICPAVLCPAIVCPLIARVTFVPCCCKGEKLKTTTVTGPCCTTKCVIPTFTEYTGCPTPTATKY